MTDEIWLYVWDMLDNGHTPEAVYWDLHGQMIQVEMEDILAVKSQLMAQQEG